MNFRLFLAGIFIPSFIKTKGLCSLFELTARAFQTDMPEIRGESFESCLEKYAHFTKAAAERVIGRGEDTEAVKARLYQNACDFGRRVGRGFRLNSMTQVMKAARLLYHLIGIGFRGNAAGEIIIDKCYFSSFYSPQVCGLISSLDEGLLAGLAGEGRLSFVRRITEGADYCRALFRIEEPRP
jgi:hypothetical protein